MGAVKAILDEIGPRNEDSGSSEEEQRLRKKNSSVKQLLKDTVGAIREKKYIKGWSLSSIHLINYQSMVFVNTKLHLIIFE
jgi:hypothetical protein